MRAELSRLAGPGLAPTTAEDLVEPSSPVLRMSGKPSLPPITMTLLFCEVARLMVASMPRRRRYSGVMVRATVSWKSRIPSASIFLRSRSFFSRSMRKSYSSVAWYCSALRSIAALILWRKVDAPNQNVLDVHEPTAHALIAERGAKLSHHSIENLGLNKGAGFRI